MSRSKMSIVVYLLIGLAIFGFATRLFTDTASLLTSILIMVAVGAVVYGAVYYFFIRKRTSDELKKYKKAVKQSKNKYKKDDKKAYAKSTTKPPKKQSPFGSRKRNLKSRANHLRVIEGNKEKGKNRASF